MKSKSIFFYLFTLFIISSCNDVDDEILPIVGVYESHVIGLAGPFSMNVSVNFGDDVLIEAPFDGDVWSVVEADIDDTNRLKWDIDIYRQSLAPGIEIWGQGFYFDETIQLNYSMSFFGNVYDYKIVGSR
jgi:hypothetical protein